MADLSLCASETCPARRECRRNEACPQRHRFDPRCQSMQCWELDKGEECCGFWPVEVRDAD